MTSFSEGEQLHPIRAVLYVTLVATLCFVTLLLIGNHRDKSKDADYWKSLTQENPIFPSKISYIKTGQVSAVLLQNPFSMNITIMSEKGELNNFCGIDTNNGIFYIYVNGTEVYRSKA